MTTVTAECKTCGTPFEKRVVRGVPVATVNCPACRGRAPKAADEAPKATVEFRGAKGFTVVTPEGAEVATGTVKAAVVAEAEAAGHEVDPAVVYA